VMSFVRQLDQGVEHGVLVAFATGGTPVDDQVASGLHVAAVRVVGIHGVLRVVRMGEYDVPPQGLEP
jgi:hypothetical protein